MSACSWLHHGGHRSVVPRMCARNSWCSRATWMAGSSDSRGSTRRTQWELASPRSGSLADSRCTMSSTSCLAAGPSRSGSAAAYALSAGQKSAAAASRSFCASAAPYWPLVSVLKRSLVLGNGARQETYCAAPRRRGTPPRAAPWLPLPPASAPASGPQSSTVWTASGACRRTAGDSAELRSLCRISIARYCASYGAASGLGSCGAKARARVRSQHRYEAPVRTGRYAPRPPRRRGAAPRGSRRAPASRAWIRECARHLDVVQVAHCKGVFGYSITSYP